MEDYKKKYEEALENIKRIKAANKDNKELVDFIEHMFPELKESEDDVMRKMAIKAVYAPEAQSCIKSWGINPEDVIAWLEKQGEQNHVWSEEDEEMYKEVLTDIIYIKNDLEAKECLGLSKRVMKAFNWFSKRYKSLTPQNIWKPRESDIHLLESIANGKSNPQDFQASLGGLIEQLKKLKE